MRVPTHPPSNAPTMPMTMVIMMPPGSFPGMMAFAIAPAAHVRSLGMIEVLFALAVSKRLFSQSHGKRDLVGIALMVIGSLLLINAA